MIWPTNSLGVRIDARMYGSRTSATTVLALQALADDVHVQ
jgi:hypothetical protein